LHVQRRLQVLDTLNCLRAMSESRWDLAAYDAEVRESQAKRWVVYEAFRNGSYFPRGLPDPATRIGTLHAQSHKSRRARGEPTLSARRMTTELDGEPGERKAAGIETNSAPKACGTSP